MQHAYSKFVAMLLPPVRAPLQTCACSPGEAHAADAAGLVEQSLLSRAQDVRRRVDSTTARAAAFAPTSRPAASQPVRVTRATSPPPPPKIVSFKTPGGKPGKSLVEQDAGAAAGRSAPLISEDKLYDPLFHGGAGGSSTAPSQSKQSAGVSEVQA